MKLKVSKNTFYINYYKALNFILNFTPKELAILSELSIQKASLPKDLSDDSKDYLIFSASNRKQTAESLGISIFNFNNHIKHFKDNNIILDIRVKGKKKRLSLNPRIYVDVNLITNSKISVLYELEII
jgi:hypothetical protein